MTKVGLALVVTLLVIMPVAAAGRVYRWVDAQGTVQYSDRPPQPGPATTPEPERVELMVATPLPPQRSVTVDELLSLSGLRAQLGVILSQLSSELRPAQVAAGERAEIDRVLASTFSTETLYPVIRDEVARGVEPARMAATAAWLYSPLGARITALEAVPSSPERQRALADYVARLAQDPPAAARLALVQRLDWIGGDAALWVDLSLTAARSRARAIQSVLPPPRRMKPGQIDSQIDALRARAAGRAHETVLASMLFVYQSLSDTELSGYAGFLGSEAGRSYGAAVRRGLSLAVRTGADRAAAQLVRVVPPERWVPPAPANAASP